MGWEDDFMDGDDCCCCDAEMTACRRLLCSRIGKVTLLVLTVLCVFWLFSSPTTDDGAAVGGPMKPYSFNHSYGVNILNRLCDDYRDERASGDLCNRLCYDRAWDIQDLYVGNKIVFTLMLGGQKVVLKSQHAYIEAFDILDDRVPIEMFTEKILELTNYQLKLGWPDDYKRHLIETLWPSLFRTGNLSVADRHSLWALVNQDEYLTFKVLPLSRVFPKVMGTCGHFYAVEYLVPFRMKSYYTNLKAKILVHLMGTLKLFYEFLNEPLHWCDVKFDNFGLSAEYPKRFLIMDGDMVFTESRMRHFLQSTKCAQDTDCHFFDCEAKCNHATGHCTDRVNDNIDVFCKKLVTQLFGNFWTKSNRYLAACHDESMNATERLADLRLVWSWSLSDV